MSNKHNAPNKNDILTKGFCKSHDNSNTLDKSCNKLSQKSCNLVNCCVYAHDKKTDKSTCVAGSGVHGPTYKSDGKQRRIDYDYWYYLGKRYPKN